MMIWLILAILVLVPMIAVASGRTIAAPRRMPWLRPGRVPLPPTPGEADAPREMPPREPAARIERPRPVTVESLQEDFTEGRISVEEYERRLDALFGGRTD